MDFDQALRDIRALVSLSPWDAAARAVELLRSRFLYYHWVGIYWLAGPDLVLGPWSGTAATDHTRIPIWTGVCGAAAASACTEIVADVRRDARYLACFPSTKSEIVVPIRLGDRVVGEIDIEGRELNAFGPADQWFLESVAPLLASLGPLKSPNGIGPSPPSGGP